MKTTTVSKRFVALFCCIAVCIALIATALGFNLASRAQAEDAQEGGIELLEEEPTGDIQIIEEETEAVPEDNVGGEASQVGETAVTEETQTPAEEPASGEPDETTIPDDSTEPEGSTEPESPAVPEGAAEPENPAESEGAPEESGEPEDAEPAGSEESAEPDLPGTEATGETVDAEEAEPDDTDAIAEEGDTNAIDDVDEDAIDVDAEEDATSEDDYGIMLLADTVAGGTFGAEGDNLEWVLDDEGVLTISGTGAMEDWSTVGSEPWYSYRSSITSIIIGEGVTHIGEGAFENCESLESVELPTTLTSIGDYAFFDCIALTSISIPYGITSIDEGTFNYCVNLKSVELPTTLTSIGDNAFFECYALADISIPAGVTSIGLGAFAYCESIESLELPNILTSIGNWAFYDCISLTGISIPAGITSIGEGTFEYCENLASVELPSTLTSIGDGAFRRCYALTDISIPYGVTSIGYATFADCTSLTSVELPSTLTSIDNYAFQNCPLNGDSMIDMTTVSAGAEVYSIDSEGTTWITQTTSYTGHTLTLPESVTSVGRYAFDNTSVDYFVIGSSLTSITGNAFASNNLEAIIFDNSKDQVTVENNDYASIVANTGNDVSLIYLDGGNGFELSLTKEVIGYSGSDTFEFEIMLTQQDGTPFSGELEASLSDGTEYVVSFTDGNATVEIVSGATLTLLWVPENTEWSIVEVTPADGIAILVNGSEAAEAEGTLTEDTAVTFTNYYKIKITVSIVWDDADNEDGLRPDSVLVQLVVDEDPYSDPVELNADNGWSTAWSDLDSYADGHEIEYVVQVEVCDGYETDGDWIKNGDGTYSLVITNTHTPEGETPAPTMSADIGDGTEVNPGESITYTIGYTNGSEDGATITITDVLDSGLEFVSATDGGTYDEATRTITWIISDVAANAEGSVSFTVVVNESAVVAGEVSNTATVQINDEPAVATNTVTNPVKVASTVTFEVVKVWDDNNDLYGERPELIVVVLLENGKATTLTQLLSAENSWTGTFSDLPEYDENGEKIVYSIAEVTVPNYTSVITGDQDSGFTVTNTYDFDEITNPEPGNPEPGTPDSGNPNTGTPNTGNPQCGNPEPGIPQTGQDSLPIAPIAVSGIVIVMAGVALLVVRRRRAA